MKDGRPTQPKVVGDFATLSNTSRYRGCLYARLRRPFHAFECLHLGEDDAQQSALVEQLESNRRPRAQDDLVQLGVDPLLADDLHAVGISLDGSDVGVGDAEVELGGKSNRPQHPQRIIAERNVRIKWCLDASILQVANAFEGVDEVAERPFIQAYGEGIDSEVPSVLVIFDGSVLHDGLAAAAFIGFFSGSDELDLPVAVAEHGRAEVFEDRDFASIQCVGGFLGQFDAAAFNHDIDVFAPTLKQEVPHESTNGVG